MASTPGSKRPDPVHEQREALNRAVNRGAVTNAATIPAAPATLDTFNATRAPSAAEAAAAAVTLDREDDGLNHVGESSQDNDGAQDLNNDESGRANNKAAEFWETVAADEREDEGAYADDPAHGSPFDFVNPGRERLAQHMENIFPEEDQQTGGGTAAGRNPPTTSGSGSPFGNAGGTGAYGATNPFTGQGMGLNAYGTPGIPGVGTGGSKGGANDPLFGLMSARVDEASAAETSPSVADGEVSGALGALAGIVAPVAPEAAAIIGVAAGAAWSIEQAAEAKEGLDANKAERKRILNEAADKLQSVGSPADPPPNQSVEKSGQSVEPTSEDISGIRFTDNQGNKIELSLDQEVRLIDAQRKNGVNPIQDPGPDGSDVGGRPSESEIAFRAYIHQQLNYHGSPGHNEGDSTPTPEGNAVGTGSVSITHSRDLGHALFGQPAEDGPSMRGGTPTPGFLPGDQGDVDPGEDSDTGAWTSNSRTEQPEDALKGFGGSGLSISDARRNADEDEDEEDDDQDV